MTKFFARPQARIHQNSALQSGKIECGKFPAKATLAATREFENAELSFFSFTGLMLDHEEWFGFAAPRIVKKEGTLPETTAREPDKLAIVEKLRKDFGVTGALDSFETDDDRLTVTFRSPACRDHSGMERHV